MICLAPADIVQLTEAIIHPICWSSTIIKRQCRATLMAEAFAIIHGTEKGAVSRAAVVDMKGQLGELRAGKWEEAAAKHMGHVWFTDCDSLYEHLVAPRLNSIENKRLAIDLKALRQQIWERNGERTLTVDQSCGDYPIWIDTSAMIVDPMTKKMDSSRLINTMATGSFDMKPTEESIIIKKKSKELRKKKKAHTTNSSSIDSD